MIDSTTLIGHSQYNHLYEYKRLVQLGFKDKITVYQRTDYRLYGKTRTVYSASVSTNYIGLWSLDYNEIDGCLRNLIDQLQDYTLEHIEYVENEPT